ERARRRDHRLDLYGRRLGEVRVLTSVALTADDAAGWAAGSAEQQSLRHWLRALPRARRTAMYAGADEVGAVLVARLLAQRYGRAPQIQLRCADSVALARTRSEERRVGKECRSRWLQ